ncbi:hypothetical protein ABH994_003482 [Bradyrhizobium yuanmingense]|uniref:phage integrase central domain-containing protein n=1 Tax=Bradyrhizobium yuanmingense TaxID=108015 RepID=UPI003513D95D
MAKVRKRTLPSGLVRWHAGYIDGGGQRRFKMFEKKSEAEAWLVEVRHDVARGTHTPGSLSPTVKDAAALWIKRCGEKRLEPMTVKGYEEHVDLHIVPFIGAKKLSEITVPAVNAFADQLRDAGRSAEMIKRVVRSLGSIFKEARRRGLANTSPTAGIDLDLPDREDPRPVIPSKAELQAIINGASGRWRPLMLVAIFCGLRASELRGLRWADVDLEGIAQYRQTEIEGGLSFDPLPSDRAERSPRMEAGVPQGRSGPRFSEWRRQGGVTFQPARTRLGAHLDRCRHYRAPARA